MDIDGISWGIDMPAKLQTLPSTATIADVVAAVERDGACVVDQLLSHEAVDQMLAEAEPYLERTGMGGDKFAGFQTQRTGGLLARTKSASTFAAHPLVMGACEQYLGRYWSVPSSGFLFHAMLTESSSYPAYGTNSISPSSSRSIRAKGPSFCTGTVKSGVPT